MRIYWGVSFVDTLQQISRSVNGLRILAANLECEAVEADRRARVAFDLKAREIDLLCQGFERRLLDIRLLSLTRSEAAESLACGLLTEIRSERQRLKVEVRHLRVAVERGDSWAIEESVSASWREKLMDSLENLSFLS